MIDGKGQQATVAPPRPRLRDVKQRHGVAAARQGEGDRRVNVGVQPLIERRLDVLKRRQPAHLAAAAVAAARAFTDLGAVAP